MMYIWYFVFVFILTGGLISMVIETSNHSIEGGNEGGNVSFAALNARLEETAAPQSPHRVKKKKRPLRVEHALFIILYILAQKIFACVLFMFL